MPAIANGTLFRLDSVLKARSLHAARTQNLFDSNEHDGPVSDVLECHAYELVSRSAHIRDVHFSGDSQIVEHADESSAATATEIRVCPY